jgi:hypothetical protein
VDIRGEDSHGKHAPGLLVTANPIRAALTRIDTGLVHP